MVNYKTYPPRKQRVVSDAQRIAILDKHNLWLKGENLYTRADFNHSFHRKPNFSNSDLTRVRFSRATVIQGNFSNTNLTAVHFIHSSLVNANFSNAILTYTNFNAADLTGANFCNTVFDPNALPNGGKGDWKPSKREGYVLGYRTARSFYGDDEYKVGFEYTAPVFSTCPFTSCHPGMYIDFQPVDEGIEVEIRRSDLHSVGKFHRCKRFKVTRKITSLTE